MRAGIQRLAEIVALTFGDESTNGALYIFVSRSLDKVRMLRFEVNGWCMYYCRLCKRTFKWQHVKEDEELLLVIERRQLIWLLEGLEFSQPKAPKPVISHTIL